MNLIKFNECGYLENKGTLVDFESVTLQDLCDFSKVGKTEYDYKKVVTFKLNGISRTSGLEVYEPSEKIGYIITVLKSLISSGKKVILSNMFYTPYEGMMRVLKKGTCDGKRFIIKKEFRPSDSDFIVAISWLQTFDETLKGKLDFRLTKNGGWTLGLGEWNDKIVIKVLNMKQQKLLRELSLAKIARKKELIAEGKTDKEISKILRDEYDDLHDQILAKTHKAFFLN